MGLTTGGDQQESSEPSDREGRSHVRSRKETAMRRSLWIVAAILLVLTAANAQEKGGQRGDTTEETLIANERALINAVAKADKATFLSLVAPEGEWTTTQGFIPLNLLADGLEGFRLSKWEILNPQLRRLTEDSAMVVYLWTVTGTFNGTQLPPTMLASTAWTRRSGKWLAVHHQDTELTKTQP
jgi:hypothetical protein